MNTLTWKQRIAGTVMLAGLLAPIIGALCPTSALAQAQLPGPAPVTPGPQAPYALTYASRFTVRADKTATQISTVRYKILAPGAIQPLSQQRLSYVEGMERLETLEAYTEKADGTKVPVQPASIITRDGASGSVATYTRDLKERIIIFPNVEVGDTLVMTNKEEMLRGLFPGQFYYADTFPRSIPLASARIVVEAPKTLDLQVKTLGTGLTDQIEESGAIRRHIVTLAAATLRAGRAGSGFSPRPRAYPADLHLQILPGDGTGLSRCRLAQGCRNPGNRIARQRDHQRHRRQEGAGDRNRRVDEEKHPLCGRLSVIGARHPERCIGGLEEQVRRLQGQGDADVGAARSQGHRQRRGADQPGERLHAARAAHHGGPQPRDSLSAGARSLRRSDGDAVGIRSVGA